MSFNCKAYAKINLWLDITGTRPDGYHTLNTVMRRIDLYDDIELDVNEYGTVGIECDEPAVPCGEENIAYRAVRAFSEHIGRPVGADIRIHKRIPLEAGLGGSSADGAAVLCELNELYGYPLSGQELCSLGASLGADVPFCIKGGTAVCSGIGDIIQHVDCADFAVVVVKPDFPCSTGAAYRRYDAAPVAPKPGFAAFCRDLREGAAVIGHGLYNVFETLYGDARLELVKRELVKCGATGASLSGSGSAVFGVFTDPESARSAAERLPFATKFTAKAL